MRLQLLIALVLTSSAVATHAVAAEEAELEPRARAAAARPAREYFIGGGFTAMSTSPAGKEDYGPGVNVVLYYGGRHWAGVAQFIVGGTYTEALSVSYGGYSVGGRYRFFDTAVTPFVGAGLAAASTGVSSFGHDSDGGLGLAPYGEVGGEVFRHSTIRGLLTLRVDQPLFDTYEDTNRRNDREGRPVYDTGVISFVPISLNLSVGWGFGSRDPIR